MVDRNISHWISSGFYGLGKKNYLYYFLIRSNPSNPEAKKEY